MGVNDKKWKCVMGNGNQRPIDTAAIAPIYCEGAEFEEIDGTIHITAWVDQPAFNGRTGDVERIVVARWMIREDNFWRHGHAVRKMTRPGAGDFTN